MARPLGTPTWIDYTANGLGPSLTFYERLAGWSIADQGETYGHYHLASGSAGEVAGLMDTTGMPCPGGGEIPTAWDVYLAVENVDETLAKARVAGAEVVVEAMDVPGRGRTAMILGPDGAPIGLWEERGFAGFPDSMAPGCPVWFEFMSKDAEASRRFYTEVFGFDYQPMPMSSEDVVGADAAVMGDPPGYWTNGTPETATSGLCDASSWLPAGARSYWRWYLSVPSTDAALDAVRELGGSVLDGPTNTPWGRMATIADPAGATLQLMGANSEG